MHLTIRGMMAGALLVTASQLEAQQPRQNPPQQFQQFQQSQQPQRRQPRQDAVAMVNGDAITKTELQARLQRQLQGKQVDPQSAEKLRKQTLDTLIESRLIEQHVAKKGPDVKDEEVDSAISRVKQQLADQKIGYDQFLASRGYTEKSFKKRIEGSLGWQKYQQQQLNEQNLRDFFEKNRDKFQADSFEQAQRQVVQAYASSLWDGVVRRMKPKAEIKILEPGLKQQKERRPSLPGSFPR